MEDGRHFRSTHIALANRGSGWGGEEEWEDLPKPQAQIVWESQAWACQAWVT